MQPAEILEHAIGLSLVRAESADSVAAARCADSRALPNEALKDRVLKASGKEHLARTKAKGFRAMDRALIDEAQAHRLTWAWAFCLAALIDLEAKRSAGRAMRKGINSKHIARELGPPEAPHWQVFDVARNSQGIGRLLNSEAINGVPHPFALLQGIAVQCTGIVDKSSRFRTVRLG